MKLKQKRGWLKAGLTAAIVLTFMLALSVTAMAREVASISFEPVLLDGADLAIAINVTFPEDGGIADLALNVTWDDFNQLVAISPFVQNVDVLSVPLQPLIGDAAFVANGGRIVFDPTPEMIEVFPQPNWVEPGRMATVRFNAADDADISAAVTLGMSVHRVGHMVGASRLIPPAVTASVATPPQEFRIVRVIWNYYGNTTANQNFIDLVIPGGAANEWFEFLHNDVWLGALNGEGTIYEALATWLTWLED